MTFSDLFLYHSLQYLSTLFLFLFTFAFILINSFYFEKKEFSMVVRFLLFTLLEFLETYSFKWTRFLRGLL